MLCRILSSFTWARESPRAYVPWHGFIYQQMIQLTFKGFFISREIVRKSIGNSTVSHPDMRKYISRNTVQFLRIYTPPCAINHGIFPTPRTHCSVKKTTYSLTGSCDQQTYVMITGIAHVNLTVPSGTLEKAYEFYGETLGLNPTPVPELQKGTLAWCVPNPGGQFPLPLHLPRIEPQNVMLKADTLRVNGSGSTSVPQGDSKSTSALEPTIPHRVDTRASNCLPRRIWRPSKRASTSTMCAEDPRRRWPLTSRG
jgi:catechol 2,3-dioxygenase-like lactoylglutathione lyase family enzyme